MYDSGYKLERVWKEAVVAQFMVLSLYFIEETDETTKTLVRIEGAPVGKRAVILPITREKSLLTWLIGRTPVVARLSHTHH
jgi:hypothetical protein